MVKRRTEYFYDARCDGYTVWDGDAWVFVGSDQLTLRTMKMGGVPPRSQDQLSAVLLALANEGNMARKEIKIEIVADLENDQFDAVLEAARDAARTVLTMAMVVTTKNKKPTVKVVSSDFMSGEREWTIDTEEVT